MNISMFGNTVTRAEKRFYKSFNENLPDMVIFGLGGNDCDFNWIEVSENPKGIHVPKTRINEFSNKLENMVSAVEEKGKKPILMNLPPLDPEKYLNWISGNDAKRKSKILEWLESVSKIYWWQERYNSAVQDIAQKRKVELIDIRGEFLKKYDFRDCLCEDGIHPNAKGQQLIAGAMTNHFKYIKSA